MARKKQRLGAPVKSVSGAAKAKSIPTGVKIIAVLAWISAVFLIFLALLLFLGAGFAEEILKAGGEELGGISAGILAGIAAFMGIILLALGILYIFVGRGLWKGRAWARIVAIVLAIIGILYNSLSLAENPVWAVFWIIAYGVIGSYLWFNKDVKAVFVR